MLRLTFFIGFILCGQTSFGQFFSPSWICSPQVDSTSQIWFRQDFPFQDKPDHAYIRVTTTGRFELFVNRYNVSTDVLEPFRPEENESPIAIVYNVSRFLRKGCNTISLWYSPTYPHINTMQIAVNFYGEDQNGQHFSHFSDENWICKPANRSLIENGGERQDASNHSLIWNSDDYDLACWTPAKSAKAKQDEYVEERFGFYTAEHIKKIHTPSHFDVNGDSIIFSFDSAFTGWIRVTMRNTQKDEKVYINGLEYICNGNLDEQAFRKFSKETNRQVLIHGDQHFKIEQIQQVEGIEITQQKNEGYMY